MSVEKVRRYNLNLTQVIHLGETQADYVAEMLEREGTGRYIEYADVAGLVEALSSLVDACPSDYVDHSAISNARNELARWQS